jgi:hypothetical protein
MSGVEEIILKSCGSDGNMRYLNYTNFERKSLYLAAFAVTCITGIGFYGLMTGDTSYMPIYFIMSGLGIVGGCFQMWLLNFIHELIYVDSQDTIVTHGHRPNGKVVIVIDFSQVGQTNANSTPNE